MDNLSQLGQDLKGMGDDAEIALNRAKPQVPRIERARDIFDSIVPFEMTFRTQHYDTAETIYLDFTPPPNNCCCTNCLCSQCEFFTGTTDETLTLTHDIYGTDLTILINDVETTDYVISSSNSITLGFSLAVEDEVKICYTFEILVFGSTKCEDCQQPAYVELIEYPKDFDSVIINEFTTIVNAPAQNGQFTASVGATFASYIGHPTWAHSTQGLPPNEDTPIENIPIGNPLAAVDGDPSSCSTTTAVVMRTGASDVQPNGTGYAVFWEIHFGRPVKLCAASFNPSEINTGTQGWSILYARPDGTQDVTTGEALNVIGGVELTAFKIIFSVIIFMPSAFNLFGVPRVDLCDVQICVADVNCLSVEALGLLP